jgi:hypothetical protein
VAIKNSVYTRLPIQLAAVSEGDNVFDICHAEQKKEREREREREVKSRFDKLDEIIEKSQKF